MRNQSNRTDLCPQGNQININLDNRQNRFFINPAHKRFNPVWIISIISAVLLSAGPALGQISVQPMKMELPVTPGKRVKTTLDIQNYDPNSIHVIDLTVHELTQLENGVWQIVDPNDPNTTVNLSNLSSCSNWISFSKQSVDVSPLGREPIIVDIKVPRGIRGFYAAAILVSVRPRPTMTDVAVGVRFLIPVIVEIQARSPRHNITIGDVGMEFVEQKGEHPSTVLATLDIENNGQTYSRLKPLARIWRFSEGHWRVVTTTTFRDASIIPGVKFKLKHDIGRSLPSGKYRISGALYVDGRRIRGVQKELDFVGDTTLKTAAHDVPLDLIPRDISIEAFPGSTRLSTIKIHNATEETVNVQTATGLPHILQNAVVSDLNGNDLDATEWITVSPENFTLPGYGQQNLMITAKMPSPGVMYPCYYSLLALWVTYPDGQKAGVATAKICLENNEIEVAPRAEPLLLKINHLDKSKYLVVAKFANFGTIHFTPIKCRAIVATLSGQYAQTASLTSEDPGMMLPLEVRMFSGIVDFGAVPAGMYRLAAGLKHSDVEGGVAEKQLGIRVSTEGEDKLVETIQMEEELPQKIEIQW